MTSRVASVLFGLVLVFAPQWFVRFLIQGGEDEKERPSQHPRFLEETPERSNAAGREAAAARTARRGSGSNAEAAFDIDEVRAARLVGATDRAGGRRRCPP